MSLERKNISGFSLVELIVVILIISVIATIVIPGYTRFTVGAKEAAVRENMRTVQTAIEMFAVDNDGTYPQPADDAAVRALLQNNQYPMNPFTNAVTTVAWNVAPANPGEISISNLPGGGYRISGRGAKVPLTPDIQNGN